MSKVLEDSNVAHRVEKFFPAELDRYLSARKGVILNIQYRLKFVDTKTILNEIEYYMTRDPFKGPRAFPASALQRQMSYGVNAIVIGE